MVVCEVGIENEEDDAVVVVVGSRNTTDDAAVYVTAVVVVVILKIHFFFFGEAAFLDFGEDEAEPEAEAGDLAVLGLGAFGFLVGPALLDFFAFDGDLDLDTAETDVAAFDATGFFSATDFLDLAAATATFFFSAAVFLAFGEFFFVAFVDCEALSADAAAATRFVVDFFALATAVFFFSVPEGFADPDEADANLKDPEAPFPFV